MHAEPLRVLALRPADILLRRAERRGPGNERRVDAGVLAHRQRLHRLAREHLLLRHALYVHERRFAGHRDRFGELADAEVRVDGGDKSRGDIDAFAAHGSESLQREGDHVGAGPEIDDPVAPLAVGDDGARPFDERRARGLHRHAGEHRATFVTHNTRDGAARGVLCRGNGGHSEKDQNRQNCRRPEHEALLARLTSHARIRLHWREV